MNTLSKKGMVAILFLAFRFLVFSYLVVSNKVAQKETFVGKEALETYLGGQDFERIRFYYTVAATHALDQALQEQSAQGGLLPQDNCMKNGYRMWFTKECPYSSDELRTSLSLLFDPLFHTWVSEIHDDINIDVTFPTAYEYVVDDQSFVITSKEHLIYRSHGKEYSVVFSLPVEHPNMNTFFSFYDDIILALHQQAPCLLSQPNDPGTCFASNSLSWAVSFSDDYYFFTVTSDELQSDIEVRFAIPLNSLDQLKATDELFISSFEADSP